MGLDIVAFGKLRQVDEETKGSHHVFDMPEWSGRIGGLQPGYYMPVDPSQEIHFRAGSYSSYGHWRRQLCLMALQVDPEIVWAAPASFAISPFIELINFSDCEGCIGPITARTLADDFKNFRPKAEALNLSYFLEIYDHFHEAFKLASDGGVVIFC